MGQDLPDEGLRALLAKIERRGLSVTSYREPCLRRRLAVRMRARGVHTFGDYASLLERMPEELDLLLDALTINVTKFFRNPETYAVLQERVVPELAARGGRVSVWSAGSATGEEAYSLAILFAAAAGTSRVRIDATDLDPGALALSERAEYPASAVEDVPQDLAAWAFRPGGPPFHVADRVRRLVRTVRHDLTRDAAPAPPYHLIVCRNVVIYFDRPTQERLFERFHEALVPGGWLLLGKVETLFGAARALFRTEDARERLFRRPA
ncbi:MAG: CheR family methyltransferase [Gemmatimonadales bacterium]